ncbi:MAG: TlpA family protein disulfide reductase [Desulfobaccales bacterium]
MERLKKIALVIVIYLGLSALPPVSWGAGAAPGKSAPDFQVESADSQKLSLDMLRGKVIVLFYESRRVTRKNIELKNELKRLYREQPAHVQKDIFRLVVIDCSEAIWPTLPIWKSKLRENSRKEGFPIYGDWTRRMYGDYHMVPDESNFLIIDKHGVVRYAAVGKIDKSEFAQIFDILNSLVREG